MTQIFVSQNGYFATRGNGQFGNVTRTGWKPTRLGEAKKSAIIKALNDSDTDQVYRRGNKVFRTLLNGTEETV